MISMRALLFITLAVLLPLVSACSEVEQQRLGPLRTSPLDLQGRWVAGDAGCEDVGQYLVIDNAEQLVLSWFDGRQFEARYGMDTISTRIDDQLIEVQFSSRDHGVVLVQGEGRAFLSRCQLDVAEGWIKSQSEPNLSLNTATQP